MNFSNLESEILLISEIESQKEIWQNEFHEFDLYNHTLACVGYLKEMNSHVDLLVAGYLHDIGKCLTKVPTKVVFDNYVFKCFHAFNDYDIVGEEMIRSMNYDFFDNYNLNKEKIAKLVGAHYLPMKGIKKIRESTNWLDFVNSYENLKENLHETELRKEDILNLFLADNLAKGNRCSDFDELELIYTVLLKDDLGLKKVYDVQSELYGGKN